MAAWDPIQHNWNELVEKMTNVDNLLDHLCEKHVIAAADRDAIKREKDALEKVRKLLPLIQKHQKDAAFQKSLRQTGNESLAEILGTGIACVSLRGVLLDTEQREPTEDAPVVLGPNLGSGIRLSTLRGCAYNAKMNKLYIASVGNGQVFVCNSQGQNPGVFHRVDTPCDVAVSPDGDRVCVIAEVFNTVLHILTWKGELKKTIDSFLDGKLSSKLGGCEAVACSNQNIAVLSGKHGLVIFNQDGDYIRKWKLKNMVGRGMAMDGDGRVYITDSKTGAVTVFSLEGEALQTFGEVRKNPWSKVKEKLLQGGVLKNPWSPGICVDSNGNVCVSRFEANRVDVYNRERNVVASFGSKGSETGQFDGPCGLCLLSGGKLVVTDANNSRIQIFKVFD